MNEPATKILKTLLQVGARPVEETQLVLNPELPDKKTQQQLWIVDRPTPKSPPMLLRIEGDRLHTQGIVDEVHRYRAALKVELPAYCLDLENWVYEVCINLSNKETLVTDRQFRRYDPADPIWAKLTLNYILHDWTLNCTIARPSTTP